MVFGEQVVICYAPSGQDDSPEDNTRGVGTARDERTAARICLEESTSGADRVGSAERPHMRET